jgi:hypothetical protein
MATEVSLLREGDFELLLPAKKPSCAAASDPTRTLKTINHLRLLIRYLFARAQTETS